MGLYFFYLFPGFSVNYDQVVPATHCQLSSVHRDSYCQNSVLALNFPLVQVDIVHFGTLYCAGHQLSFVQDCVIKVGISEACVIEHPHG